ncbi:tRNA preQ1(34) S-adenosylmethionine ribosyltransferase-isomerase QueA [Acuticoccus sp. I52.16.1]|uniref:tRNA preQ1(34) S-adenosylmethionine ribosyltransferase-isomerase QueA n=1 Tax=Acuticoccus sp. I52.16.1 TaxID=2928472 RepID=UPI001FD48872|nr:tRNA preQ1(34) S-adenosylmethionine ribosyltransferase-isomerase QueA [Acuticoccus sp. I52.16.1]UOM33930.1 tRNA preQ1(34) S-adenosylmethionine ribosyltransferase-isomerase QueA [Acuticoccus sp. I52.16.1]
MTTAEGETLADYDYELPDGAIALRPAVPRDAARLLVSRPGEAPADRIVRDLPSLLRPGDRLVVNDSRVVPARLVGERVRGENVSRVELTLLAQDPPGTWRAFAKPAKRVAPGDRLRFTEGARTVEAEIITRSGPEVTVRFADDPLAVGSMPLPPYIAAKRAPDAQDMADYQTVYADPAGSVAAPTAGLHFTDDLLARLAAAGIGLSRVTLHVGAGTFLPVKVERLDAHEMHAETGTVTADTVAEIAATKAAGGRVVAVGTTALRILESAAVSGALAPFEGETRIFIRPGFRFHAVDALMTNFHLPRSTLMMLVAALVGLPRMHAVYAHALAHGYRFYSYGDASLLFPDKS